MSTRELDVLLVMSGAEKVDRQTKDLQRTWLKFQRDQQKALEQQTKAAEKAAAAQDRLNKSAGAGSASYLRLVGNVLLLAQAYHTLSSIMQPVIGFMQESTKRAIDNAESINLTTVVLKDQLPILRQWSQESTAAMVNPRVEVERQAAVFYQMVNNMGLARDASLQVSTSLTDLTADMASFRNLAPDEVFTKLSAAIAGEYEPLKRIGIVLTENRVVQEALTETGKKHKEELLHSEKVMARYNLIMRQTTEDQGDLERTSGSMANVLRELEARYKDAQDSVGQFTGGNVALARVLGGVADAISVVIQGNNDFMRSNEALVRSIQLTIASGVAQMAMALTNLGEVAANVSADMAYVGGFMTNTPFTEKGRKALEQNRYNYEMTLSKNKENAKNARQSIMRGLFSGAVAAVTGQTMGGGQGNPARTDTDFNAYTGGGGGGGRSRAAKDAWLEANRGTTVNGWNSGSSTPLGNMAAAMVAATLGRAGAIPNPRALINFSRIGYGSLASGDTAVGRDLRIPGAGAPRTLDAGVDLGAIISRINGGYNFERLSDMVGLSNYARGAGERARPAPGVIHRGGMRKAFLDPNNQLALFDAISGGAGQIGSTAGGIAGSALTAGMGGVLGVLGGPLGAFLGGGLGRGLKKLFGGGSRPRGETRANPLYTHDVAQDERLTQLLNVIKGLLNRSAAGGVNALTAQLGGQTARAGGLNG